MKKIKIIIAINIYNWLLNKCYLKTTTINICHTLAITATANFKTSIVPNTHTHTVNIITKMLTHMKIAIPILFQTTVLPLTNNIVHLTTIAHIRITIKKITPTNTLNH